MSAPSAPQKTSRTSTAESSFPKSARLLRPAEFRSVYDRGRRYTCAQFSAFCWQSGTDSPARFGFTLPRAIGKAVFRNRIRRRLREIIRAERERFPAGWWIVFNPRRAAHDAPVALLREEIAKLIERCQR